MPAFVKGITREKLGRSRDGNSKAVFRENLCFFFFHDVERCCHLWSQKVGTLCLCFLLYLGNHHVRLLGSEMKNALRITACCLGPHQCGTMCYPRAAVDFRKQLLLLFPGEHLHCFRKQTAVWKQVCFQTGTLLPKAQIVGAGEREAYQLMKIVPNHPSGP